VNSKHDLGKHLLKRKMRRDEGEGKRVGEDRHRLRDGLHGPFTAHDARIIVVFLHHPVCMTLCLHVVRKKDAGGGNKVGVRDGCNGAEEFFLSRVAFIHQYNA